MKYLSSLALLFVLLSACKKTDEAPPILTVTTPVNMSSIAFGDVLTVSGTATDDESLKSIKIELLYNNLNATDFSFEMNVNNNSYDFTKSFELDDRHMPTSNYYLKVTAIDRAGNRDEEYIELNYGELPKELQGIAMVDKVNNSVYDLYFYDNTSVNFIQSFAGDFQDLLADSYNLLLWLTGGSAGDLLTYDLNNDVVNWHQSPQVSFYPYFGNLHQMASDHNVAMVRGDGSVVTMDKDGIVNRTYTLGTSSQGEQAIEQNNYVIIEEVNNNNHYLTTYIKGTGSYVHQMMFTEDVIAIGKKDNDELFVITSENNNCHLYLYNYMNNSTYEPHAVDPGVLYDFCVIDADEIILAHSTGLMRFTVSNNSMVTIASDVATQLEFESLSGIIYANVNNNLMLFDHLGNSGGTITTGINVSSFALYYNK